MNTQSPALVTSAAAAPSTLKGGLRVKSHLKAGEIRCPDPDSSCTTSNHGLRLRSAAPRARR